MKALGEFFRGFRKGMKEFGENITALVNSVLLSIVYFLGVGLTSIAAKALGKHFLDKRSRNDSYWSDINLKKKPLKDYYRQF